MTIEKQLEIINQKLDLSLKALSIIPIFIASVHDKNPNKQWKSAIKEWDKIDKKYMEILKYEHNIDTTSVENKIS
jgi:hypothetical protein